MATKDASSSTTQVAIIRHGCAEDDRARRWVTDTTGHLQPKGADQVGRRPERNPIGHIRIWPNGAPWPRRGTGRPTAVVISRVRCRRPAPLHPTSVQRPALTRRAHGVPARLTGVSTEPTRLWSALVRRQLHGPTFERSRDGPGALVRVDDRFAVRRLQTPQELSMERLARLVMHHRRIVTAFWLLMFVGGVVSAGQLSEPVGLRLLATWSARRPGRPAGDRDVRRQRRRHLRRTGHRAAGTDRRRTSARLSRPCSPRAVAAVPDLTMRVVDSASAVDPGFVTEDGRTAYALIQAPVPRDLRLRRRDAVRARSWRRQRLPQASTAA